MPLINVIDDFPPATHRLGGKCILDPLEAEPEPDLGAQDLLGMGVMGPIHGGTGRINHSVALAQSERKGVGVLNPISAPPFLSANHPIGGSEGGTVDSGIGHNLLKVGPHNLRGIPWRRGRSELTVPNRTAEGWASRSEQDINDTHCMVVGLKLQISPIEGILL